MGYNPIETINNNLLLDNFYLLSIELFKNNTFKISLAIQIAPEIAVYLVLIIFHMTILALKVTIKSHNHHHNNNNNLHINICSQNLFSFLHPNRPINRRFFLQTLPQEIKIVKKNHFYGLNHLMNSIPP